MSKHSQPQKKPLDSNQKSNGFSNPKEEKIYIQKILNKIISIIDSKEGQNKAAWIITNWIDRPSVKK